MCRDIFNRLAIRKNKRLLKIVAKMYLRKEEKDMVTFILARLQIAIVDESLIVAKENYEKYMRLKYIKKYKKAIDEGIMADETLKPILVEAEEVKIEEKHEEK